MKLITCCRRGQAAQSTRRYRPYVRVFGVIVSLLSFTFLTTPTTVTGQGADGVVRLVKKHKTAGEDSVSDQSAPPSLPKSAIPNSTSEQRPAMQGHANQANGDSSVPRTQPNWDGSTRSTSAPGVAAPSTPYVTDNILKRHLGSEGFQNLLGQIQANADAAGGKGAPTSSVWWDGAQPRNGSDSAVRPSGTQFFQGSGASSANVPAPVTTGAVRHASVEDAREATRTYGSIPGGVVLEGSATGLGQITTVRYDSRFNAFILDDRAAYFMRVPPKTVAVLCKAIAQDEKERVGVSLGKTPLVYGKVPPDSALAWDLKIADHFLGSIVFAEKEWITGYRFLRGFQPEAPSKDENYHVAVFFKFHDFDFQIQQDEIHLARANFDAEILPLSKAVSAEGGHLPDEDAIAQGRIPQAYERNATHLAKNIKYYCQERIVDRVFAYGEVAALLRALKEADFDLEDLAAKIPGGS